MRTCALAFSLAIACGRAPARVGSGGPVDAGAEVFADGGVIGSSGTATLLVATSGEGLVRAADGDCRGYCTVRGNNIHLTAVPDPGATFVGWSGACSGTGDCDWALVGTATLTATFIVVPPSAQLLVPAPAGGSNEHLALNSTRVFWTQHGPPDAIWSMSKSGGEPFKEADASPLSLAADDRNLYWTDSRALMSKPIGAGAANVLFTGGFISRPALDETGALYWTESDGPQTGTVRRLQGGAMTTIASGQDPVALAVDATHVYFAHFNKAQQGEMRRVPRTGGAVETVVVSGSRYAKAIRVDARNVYFRLSDDGFPSIDTGHVLALSKADFTVRTLSAANGVDRFQLLPQLEVDGSGVYWNWNSGTPPYGIFRADTDGGRFQPIDSGSDTPWYDLAVDATAVYYVHGGAIIRHQK
jgi:hypothetical protein